MEIFIVLFLILFLALAIKKIDYAVFAIVFFLPTYLIRFSLLGIPVTLIEAMVLIAFAVWFFREIPSLRNRLSQKESKVDYPFKWEIIALLIISFISVAVAGFSASALGIWKAYFFEPILLFILLINILRNDKARQRLFMALALSALVVSLLAIYQKLTGNLIANNFWAEASTRRVVSFFSYPNALGLFLAPLLALFAGVLCYFKKSAFKHNWLKIMIFFIAIILGMLSIIFARSDGAIIALLIGFFIFAFLADKQKKQTAIVLLFLFILSAFLYSPLGNKLEESFSFQGLSGQIRLQQWKESLETFKGSSIILGNGLSSYQEAVRPYHQEGIFYNYDGLENFDAVVWASSTLREKYWQPVEIYLYPHNIFLNFWTEIGLLGALLFIWILFKAIYLSYKLTRQLIKAKDRRHYLSLGIMTAFIVIFIHGLVDVPYLKNDLSLMFFILLALLGSYKLEIENRSC